MSQTNHSGSDHRVDRRQLLRTTAAAAVSNVSPSGNTRASADSQAKAIAAENQQTGTTDWQLTRVRVNKGNFRTSLIEGYCSHQSLSAGEKLRIFVSTDPTRNFRLDIYRMGYYGGSGATRALVARRRMS